MAAGLFTCDARLGARSNGSLVSSETASEMTATPAVGRVQCETLNVCRLVAGGAVLVKLGAQATSACARRVA
ncbi:hypothetical protein PCO31111_04715 [Pandoraea communis]|uniref:Uncharacterized protein n=1 Tax=Pandoraea communis TaxID=2508297 RepID=A0A5E4YRD6_9BURK|nr:hypothetical protein PCO31111_04715 [Pandoraea communis]